jgi:hypothetical protein
LPSADAIDPYTVIAIVLFTGGLTCSLQFSAVNSPAFADVPSERTGAANTFANVVQQLTFGFGVATAAAAVHLASLLSHDAATGPHPIMAAAIVAPVSTLDALGLSPDARSLVSGDRHWRTTA